MARTPELSDLDTAFPRPNSARGMMVFEGDQYHRPITTNATKEEFEKEYLNKDIKLSYYGKTNEFTETRKLIEIRWY